MKRVNNSSNVTAFGEYLAAEQIKRSGVLRRLAAGLCDEPSAVAALLPLDQFLAWSHFTKDQNLSAERVAAVLEASAILEDPDTAEAASRSLALIIRGSFRKDLPGNPLDFLRSIPNTSPSPAPADGHSASPSDIPASGSSSCTTGAASSTPAAGPNGAMLSIHVGGTLGSSLGPSIAGSGIGSNSSPIADTQRLVRAHAAGSSSGSAFPGFAAPASPGNASGFLVPRARAPGSGTAPPTPFVQAPASPPSPASAPTTATDTAPSNSIGTGPALGSPKAASLHAFPQRSIIAALSTLSPEPLQATLRHLHLSIILHLPPRFRSAALQSRASRTAGAPLESPLTVVDLSSTNTAPSRTGSRGAIHPFIATYALILPSSLPNLVDLSLANNHLRPADAAALATATSALPSIASLNLSENPDLTAAAATSLICGCPAMKTALTRLSLHGCSRQHPAALAGALNFLDNLAELSFGPAPPRMGDTPLLAPLADPLSRMTALRALHLSGFGGVSLSLIPHLPYETLTTLDVTSAEDVVAPLHAALADQAPRMRSMRQLLILGWSCTTTDALSIDRFMACISSLPQLEALSMSGAPPHNPDLTPITHLTTLTSVKLKNFSRHLVVPLMCHLPLLRDYICIKCHTPPAQLYKSVERSGAAIFRAMRAVELVECDMDDNARNVTFKHLRGMSHLHALRITFPIGGNLSYFPRVSELQIFLPMISGLTRLELTCCDQFLPGSPEPLLDFSAQTALQILRITATDRSASPTPQAFATSVFRGLRTLTALRHLDFSQTALADLPSFVAELAPLAALTYLGLVNTAAAPHAWGWASVGTMATRLAAALSRLTALEHLALCFVPLGDEGAATLAPALGRLHRLQHLGLLKTGITEVGAAALWSHVRVLPLNRRVLINSVAGMPGVPGMGGGNGGSDSIVSGSVAVAQGHTGFPYPLI